MKTRRHQDPITHGVIIVGMLLLLRCLSSASPFEVSTTNGIGGTCGYIRNPTNSSGFGGTTIIVKNAGDNTFTRKGYVRFDTSGLSFEPEEATLSLTVATIDTALADDDQTIYVYGITSQALDLVPLASGLAWSNAPANNPTSWHEADLTKADLLGTFAVDYSGDHAAPTGTVVQFSSAALATFMAADTNDLVTFVLGRTGPAGSASKNLAFAGQTHATYAPPQLSCSTGLVSSGVFEVTTTNGTGGVSGNIKNPLTSSSFGDFSIAVKNVGSATTTRKGYIRFDTAGLGFEPDEATLSLTVRLIDAGIAGDDQTIYVYGITDQALDLTALTNGLAWSNAPANDPFSWHEADLTKADLLGTFAVDYNGDKASPVDTVVEFSSGALASFIAADVNNVVTFILGRTGPGSSGSLNLVFGGDTYATPPKLTLSTLPPPDRPFIWVRNSDRSDILNKIASNAWAQTVYNDLITRRASAVSSHQADRDAFIRSLPVDWTATPPEFKTIPTYTESVVRTPTENKFNQALDCAVLYYLTQATNYAQCAADILHNSVQALVATAPSSDVGNGGWIFQDDFLKEARVTGSQLPVIYDFLYDFLQSNLVYDVDAGGMVSFDFVDGQTVFRTLYELARDHGSKDNNWSALMSGCMMQSILALDNPAERSDALQVFMVTGSSRQASLDYDYRDYTQAGDIWPESLQYAAGVAFWRTFEMEVLEHYDAANQLFSAYPNLPLSLDRISYLRFPNDNEQICFGDGHRYTDGQPYFEYELVYAHALRKGYTNLTAKFGPLITEGVASGDYDRSALKSYSSLGAHNEPLQLLWFAPAIAEAPSSQILPRTDTLPFAGVALQRNIPLNNSTNYGLMAFVGGADHVHSHASGMSMELYGMGQVMGAKAGRSDYQSTLHENYYRLFAANNTVIVNGASRGDADGAWANLGMSTVATVSMEPQAFGAAVSSNMSFTCSSFDDKGTLADATQQRTIAIVRTSPTTGFYVDFFRSSSAVSNRTAQTLSGPVTDQYHDYIYRNIGVFSRSLETNGAALALVAQPSRFENDIGDAYEQPGWRYFTNTVVSYPHTAQLRAQYEATPTAQSTIYMDVHMPEVTEREVARVDSPPITEGPAPYNTADAQTLVVRQFGSAWAKPFVSVFEPHYGAAGGTVTNTTALWRGGTLVGVRIQSVVNGSNFTHYVLSNPQDNQVYTDSSLGLSFTGRVAVVADYAPGSYELYIGDGKSLSYRGYALFPQGGTDVEVSMITGSGAPPTITANSGVDSLTARAPDVTQLSLAPGETLSLDVSGSMGVPYDLWATTNLVPAAWTLLESGVVTSETFSVESLPATNSAMFYRITTP